VSQELSSNENKDLMNLAIPANISLAAANYQRRSSLTLRQLSDRKETQRHGFVYFVRAHVGGCIQERPAMTALRHWPVIGRTTCLLIATVTLAGCVIVPPPWHPYGPRYSYYR
jgi:hypothetical protein